MSTIIRNRIKCLRCGTVAESKYVGHFVYCACMDVACEGGKQELKRCILAGGRFEDLSVLSEVEDDA